MKYNQNIEYLNNIIIIIIIKGGGILGMRRLADHGTDNTTGSPATSPTGNEHSFGSYCREIIEN